MTDPQDPRTFTASAKGAADGYLFEKVYTELCQNGLNKATPEELAYALGVAAGTILYLRKQIADLQDARS